MVLLIFKLLTYFNNIKQPEKMKQTINADTLTNLEYLSNNCRFKSVDSANIIDAKAVWKIPNMAASEIPFQSLNIHGAKCSPQLA